MSRTTRITLLEECRNDYLELIASFEGEREQLAARDSTRDAASAEKLAANARALELLRQSLLRVEEELNRTRASLDPE
jgi:hypothetical protein